MIKQLYTDVLEAECSSRELDVRLHEVLTGEINMCKDYGQKLLMTERGQILREHSGELRWYEVPLYTDHLQTICSMFPDDAVVTIRRVPPASFKELKAMKLNEAVTDYHIKRGWLAEWSKEHQTCQAFGVNPALAAAVVLLAHKLGGDVASIRVI